MMGPRQRKMTGAYYSTTGEAGLRHRLEKRPPSWENFMATNNIADLLVATIEQAVIKRNFRDRG
jgi:hypothetical protein